ncbi:hypothetical protein [Streptomyces sp. NBC_01378]|uniref:hypothetical protein n=1 Tax=Streptomyces sp. NBC_01378 TaxID=2903844 RepID=UPI00386EE862
MALGLDGHLPVEYPEKAADRPALSVRDGRLVSEALLGEAGTEAAGGAYAVKHRLRTTPHD